VQSLAQRYGIRGIPTLIVFKAGKEAARVSGALDKRSLVQWIENA
jgi:thioredoxin 2